MSVYLINAAKTFRVECRAIVATVETFLAQVRPKINFFFCGVFAFSTNKCIAFHIAPMVIEKQISGKFTESV
jgi:hypothetical protein